MSRRVWTSIRADRLLYGNLFVILVSPPGVGKSVPLDLAHEMLLTASELNMGCIDFAGDEATREQVIQHMGKVFPKDGTSGDMSYVACLSELASFFKGDSVDWMQSLSRLWDTAPVPYQKNTKTQGSDFMVHHYLTILGAVQPKWMMDNFPRQAFDLGFSARTFFVWAGEKPPSPLFGPAQGGKRTQPIIDGLNRTIAARGMFEWNEPAKELFGKWYNGGMEPKVTDPLLYSYAERRDLQAAKLALIAAVAGHPKDNTIYPKDVERAWEWMFAVEKTMPQVTALVGGNVFFGRQQEVVEFVKQRYEATGGQIRESEVRRFLSRMVSPRDVGALLDDMAAQRIIVADPATASPERKFLPLGVKKGDKK